jgi:ABC-2 type transport system permease protein
MWQIYQAIRKEILLLKSDGIGIFILFLMPVVLVLTITPIQNSVENTNVQHRIPILIINHDNGNLSIDMIQSLREKNNFELIQHVKGKPFSEKWAKKNIQNGKAQLLLIIPKNYSASAQRKTKQNIQLLLSKVMPGASMSNALKKWPEQEIELYFDPVVSEQVKNTIRISIENTSLKTENKMIYQSFENELQTNLDFIQKQKLIQFKEHALQLTTNALHPNPIQHNFPAWALVAIFLIVIPVSNNLVKEKNQGTFVRLKTLPVKPKILLISKIIVFVLVCMVQFFLMLLVALYVFPLIGLPALQIQNCFATLCMIAFFSSIAAIGFGVLIGTIASTHEQAAPFGAMSVVILAALGGLWFPLYAMGEGMQKLAAASPMNWGLEAFYQVLVRGGKWFDLLPYLLSLFLFFILNLLISIMYEKKINQK